MNSRLLPIGLVTLALISGSALWVYAQSASTSSQPHAAKAPHKDADERDDESDEEVIDLAKAPDAVRTAAIKLAGSDNAITKVMKEKDDDVSTYEVEFTAEGVECSAVFAATGDLMEIEKSIPQAKLPEAVRAELSKEFPNATFKDVCLVQKFFYEIDVTANGKTHEIKIDANGEIMNEHRGESDHARAQHDDHDDDHRDNGKGHHEGSRKDHEEDDDDQD